VPFVCKFAHPPQWKTLSLPVFGEGLLYPSLNPINGNF
jgi:hypothetical protein